MLVVTDRVFDEQIKPLLMSVRQHTVDGISQFRARTSLLAFMEPKSMLLAFIKPQPLVSLWAASDFGEPTRVHSAGSSSITGRLEEVFAARVVEIAHSQRSRAL